MTFVIRPRPHSFSTFVIRFFSVTWLPLFLLFSLLVGNVNAQHWIQIDDTDAAIKYSGNWLQGPCGDPCLYPNTTNVWNKTWRVTTPTASSPSSFSLQFQGFAIVIGVLFDNTRPGARTEATVTLDGNSLVVPHDSENDGTVKTGASLFYKDGLDYTVHTLTVDVAAGTILMLDYIAIQNEFPGGVVIDTSSAILVPTSTSSSRGAASPSTSNAGPSSARQSTTTVIVTTGPSGTSTVPVVIPLPTTGTGATTSFDPSSLRSDSRVQTSQTTLVTTSVDSSGHTYIITTVAGDDELGPSNHSGSSQDGHSGSTPFSPALAGALGAAGAAIAAVAVVVCMLCRRRQRRSGVRPGSAEPYILANTTPSSQNSNLSGPASPIPYSPVSALGLYYTAQPLPMQDGRMPGDLLASPPPNTLATPLSPNRPLVLPHSSQQFYPYTPRHQTLPLSPPQGPTYLPYIPAAEKLNQIRSERYFSPTRENVFVEFRSPVTPLYPRPMDWDIESQSERDQPPPPPVPLHLPLEEPSTMMTMTTTTTTTTAVTPRGSSFPSSSPIVPLPSPHPSSRRRSGRQKEFLELPPVTPVNEEPVPVLRVPRAPMRRGRRGTTGQVPDQFPHEMAGVTIEMRSPASDEESLPPVIRRQSLSHPAPPAYSPPRLVRNAELHDGTYR
ncbi:hypothetical protein FRC18_006506 [Serendipita sp. 400]|nr:hypothetical protein FRC18_006506 [Serendipita sp. 400]